MTDGNMQAHSRHGYDLVAIVGPTASGKTRLAAALAAKWQSPALPASD